MKIRKLMVAGPTEIEEEVRLKGAQKMVYNRTPEFSDFINKIEDKLKMVFKTKNDVFIISSSGTGAMEAAVTNVISKGDEVIVISGGTFGDRWIEINETYGGVCKVIKLKTGESVLPEQILGLMTSKTVAVFVTVNETSTGVITDVRKIGEVVKNTNAIMVVDGVSSIGADLIETDLWHCDVAITSSQKAFAIPPGLSFISVSNKAWDIIHKSTTPKYYFDLEKYKNNIQRGQTPFTPPISLLYQLDLRLDKILSIGIENVVNEHYEKIVFLKRELKKLGIKVIGEDNHSNGVLGLFFDGKINAYDVVKKLREEYLIEVTPSPGEDKNHILRIGVFGDITICDIKKLLLALKEIINNYECY